MKIGGRDDKPNSGGADKALEKNGKVNAQNRNIQYPFCGIEFQR
jgi:hypothetical protein